MAAIQFKIDTLALGNHILKLQSMRKYDLPVVVQQTLTSAAFRVKKDTMPAEAGIFIHRKPTFFKANSKAEKATGLDIDTMQATVGFIPKLGDKSHSVEDLEAQEDGGTIKNRAFIALSLARTGSVWQGLTRTKNREAEFNKKTFNPKDTVSKYAPTDKSKFVQAAIEAAKVGGLVIGNKINQKGNRMAYQIDHVNRFFGNTYFEATPLFAVKRDREVHPKATHFMQKASMDAQKMMEADFIRLAEARILKYCKTP
jgi:hypothetical protein